MAHSIMTCSLEVLTTRCGTYTGISTVAGPAGSRWVEHLPPIQSWCLGVRTESICSLGVRMTHCGTYIMCHTITIRTPVVGLIGNRWVEHLLPIPSWCLGVRTD